MIRARQRVLQQSRPGVLFSDLNACNSFRRAYAATQVKVPTTLSSANAHVTPAKAGKTLAGRRRTPAPWCCGRGPHDDGSKRRRLLQRCGSRPHPEERESGVSKDEATSRASWFETPLRGSSTMRTTVLLRRLLPFSPPTRVYPSWAFYLSKSEYIRLRCGRSGRSADEGSIRAIGLYELRETPHPSSLHEATLSHKGERGNATADRILLARRLLRIDR